MNQPSAHTKQLEEYVAHLRNIFKLAKEKDSVFMFCLFTFHPEHKISPNNNINIYGRL